MTTMPSNVLAALMASLANPAHAWETKAAMVHEHTSTVPTGAPEGGTSSVTTITYIVQMQSAPRQLFLNFSIEGSTTTVNWQGTSFKTTDAALRNDMIAKVGPHATTRAAAFLAKLTE